MHPRGIKSAREQERNSSRLAPIIEKIPPKVGGEAHVEYEKVVTTPHVEYGKFDAAGESRHRKKEGVVGGAVICAHRKKGIARVAARW